MNSLLSAIVDDHRATVRQLLKADPEVSAALSPSELEEKFDLDYHFKHVDTIFRRVFGTA